MKAAFSDMRARYSRFWQARAAHERLIIAATAVILGVGLYVSLVQAVDRSRVELRTAVAALRARAALLELQAAEFERLRAAPAATAEKTDIRALVQAQTGAAGLSRALVSSEAAAANQVKVVFGAVAFADWLSWVAGLEAQRVRLEACRIEALATPGLVNVTATLNRPQPQ